MKMPIKKIIIRKFINDSLMYESQLVNCALHEGLKHFIPYPTQYDVKLKSVKFPYVKH